MKPDIEVPVGQHLYRIGQLSAMEQFHISRRLGPLLTAMGGEVFKLLRGRQEGEKLDIADFAGVAGPVALVLSKMSDEESEYIINTCLKVVKREQQGAWAPILTATGLPLFADINMVGMVRLTHEVVKANLGDFFPTAPDEASS